MHNDPSDDWLVRGATPDWQHEAARRISLMGVAVVLVTPEALLAEIPPALPAERAEAPRLDQAGFLMRRCIARGIASAVTGADAAAYAISRKASGAPQIAGPGAPFHLSFSTRGGAQLIGLGYSPLGVDLEMPIATQAIPWNMLRQDERLWLEGLAEATRARAFVRLWNRKEALAKALQLGFILAPEALRADEAGAMAMLSQGDGETEASIPAHMRQTSVPGGTCGNLEIALAVLR